MRQQKHIGIAVVRDTIMVALGTAGMIDQLFFRREPSGLLIGASLLCLSGVSAVNAWWLLSHPAEVLDEAAAIERTAHTGKQPQP